MPVIPPSAVYFKDKNPFWAQTDACLPPHTSSLLCGFATEQQASDSSRIFTSPEESLFPPPTPPHNPLQNFLPPLCVSDTFVRAVKPCVLLYYSFDVNISIIPFLSLKCSLGLIPERL